MFDAKILLYYTLSIHGDSAVSRGKTTNLSFKPSPLQDASFRTRSVVLKQAIRSIMR